MNKQFLILAMACVAGVASAQTFSVGSPSTVGVSSSVITGTVSSTATRTLSGSTTVANPFDRFDVRLNSTRTIAGGDSSGVDLPSATTSTPGFPVRTSTWTGSAVSDSNTDLYASKLGDTFGVTVSVNPNGVASTASVNFAAAQAPLVTSASLTGSTASAGSPLVSEYSTPSLWVFDFPGNPGTGSASINLSNVSSSFLRAADSLGLTSLHKDTVRLEVAAFLNGVQVGTTRVSGSSFNYAPGAGSGTNSLAFNAIPSITLGVGDIYGQTKNLTVVTKLIGSAFLGNGSTSLGDYTIASSTFSGVQVQGVPEPATIAGLSLGLLAFARRRKSK